MRKSQLAGKRDECSRLVCLQRYLSEFCYRFNRRFELAALLPRLLYATARTPPLPYRLATLGRRTSNFPSSL